MSGKIDVLVYENLMREIGTWIRTGDDSNESRAWKMGFRGGLIRAKRIITDLLIDEEDS